MLIYKLLGDQAQSEFARSWGVSYGARRCRSSGVVASSDYAPQGMNTASEWKDVVTEAMKGAIILAILERLYVTRSNSWFEEHLGVCTVARPCTVYTARISSDLQYSPLGTEVAT